MSDDPTHLDNLEDQTQLFIQELNRKLGVDEETVSFYQSENTLDQPTVDTVVAPVAREKKIPNKLLEKMMKYEQMVEKQKRERGGIRVPEKKLLQTSEVKKAPEEQKEGVMKKIVVGGKVKYVRVDESTTDKSNKVNIVDNKEVTKPIQINNRKTGSVQILDNIKKIINESNITDNEEKVEEKVEESSQKIVNTPNPTETPIPIIRKNRIPAKHADYIKEMQKKDAMNNAKTYSDLRKLKEMSDLDLDIDPNKFTMQELRRMNTERRRKEQDSRVVSPKESEVTKLMNDTSIPYAQKVLKLKSISAGNRQKLML